jgi:hypothetical protein
LRPSSSCPETARLQRLSRGALVQDIVNTVALTAIQAQGALPGA